MSDIKKPEYEGGLGWRFNLSFTSTEVEYKQVIVAVKMIIYLFLLL